MPRDNHKHSSSSSNNSNEYNKDKTARALTYLLRHGAEKEKVPMRPDGYVALSDITKKQKFRKLTLDQVQEIVSTCSKQRFSLTQLKVQNDKGEEVEEWFIKANQGHSLVVPDLSLVPVTSHLDVPVCVHGTYYKSWDAIKQSGLSRMSRQHIHFAVGVPSDDHVISGMRSTSELLIYADVEKMLRDGIPLLKSANDVLLCPGKGDTGIVGPEYFKSVVDVKTGAIVFRSD